MSANTHPVLFRNLVTKEDNISDLISVAEDTDSGLPASATLQEALEALSARILALE